MSSSSKKDHHVKPRSLDTESAGRGVWLLKVNYCLQAVVKRIHLARVLMLHASSMLLVFNPLYIYIYLDPNSCIGKRSTPKVLNQAGYVQPAISLKKTKKQRNFKKYSKQESNHHPTECQSSVLANRLWQLNYPPPFVTYILRLQYIFYITSKR